MHCSGSVRKSGNDLWKILTGSSVLAGTRRTEWRVCRELDMLDGLPQFLRRSERVLIVTFSAPFPFFSRLSPKCPFTCQHELILSC